MRACASSEDLVCIYKDMSILEFPSSAHFKQEFPASEKAKALVYSSRSSISDILKGKDNRLLVVVGPCSIHDPEGSGLAYARRLAEIVPRLSDRLLVVMRCYMEKPRSTIGWDGFVSDPSLKGEFDFKTGFTRARKLLLSVLELGVPVATEFLDVLSPQYLADLLSWVAVGARTAEGPAYRRMASGLDVPVGFKNGTSGNIQLSVDAVVTANSPRGFLGINEEGKVCEIHSDGNTACHIVLRGSIERGPNYDEEAVAKAMELLKEANLSPRLMIDCSHGNSNRDYRKQPGVFRNVLAQRCAGNKGIIGIMMESNLLPGKQELGDDPSKLQYGVSITDSCVGWEETAQLLQEAHDSLS